MSVARRPPPPDPDAEHRRVSAWMFAGWLLLVLAVVAIGTLLWIAAGGP